MRLRIPDMSVIREKIKLLNASAGSAGKPLSRLRGGKISLFFKPIWLGVVLLALFLSFFAGKALEGFLAVPSLNAQMELAKIANGRKPSLFADQSQDKRDREVSFAPFNPAEKTTVSQRSDPKAISSITLVGTLPQIGAWLNDGRATSLVLENQDYSEYKLRLVDTGRVILTKGEDEYYLYLRLSGKSSGNVQSSAPPARPSSAQASGNEGIEQAAEGRAGSIKKEVVEQLLLDPMSEFAKLRLVPEKDGMKVLFMENSSIMAQMGVRVGDLLTSINDIPISDVPKVTNAFSSLLTSSQFNLGLLRDSKATQLEYAVK